MKKCLISVSTQAPTFSMHRWPYDHCSNTLPTELPTTVEKQSVKFCNYRKQVKCCGNSIEIFPFWFLMIMIMMWCSFKLTLLVQCGMTSFSLNFFSNQIQCNHVLLHNSLNNSQSLQLQTIVLDCRRNARFPVHTSPPRKFSECAARFLIRPDRRVRRPCFEALWSNWVLKIESDYILQSRSTMKLLSNDGSLINKTLIV